MILSTIIENKSSLLGLFATTTMSILSRIEQIGTVAKDISAIIAVIVGILTAIKLLMDIRGKNKKRGKN